MIFQNSRFMLNMYAKYQKNKSFTDEVYWAQSESYKNSEYIGDKEYKQKYFSQLFKTNIAKQFMKFMKIEAKGIQKKYIPEFDLVQAFCKNIIEGQLEQIYKQIEEEDQNVDLHADDIEESQSESIVESSQSSSFQELSNCNRHKNSYDSDLSSDLHSMDKDSTNVSAYSPIEPNSESEKKNQKVRKASKGIKKSSKKNKSQQSEIQYESKIKKNQHQNIINQFYSYSGIKESDRIHHNLKLEGYKQFKAFCYKQDKSEKELEYFEKLKIYFASNGRCDQYYIVEKKDKMKNREGLEDRIENLKSIVYTN